MSERNKKKLMAYLAKVQQRSATASMEAVRIRNTFGSTPEEIREAEDKADKAYHYAVHTRSEVDWLLRDEG